MGERPQAGKRRACLGALLAAALFATMLFARLGHPLFWADEAETAMFAQRVLEHGYPKVHGERNVVYQFGPNIALGVKEGPDAYIGTTWAHFYVAAPALLWARGVEDPYARTWRVRLPFALLGAAGVALWILALAPVFRGEPARAWRFAALYWLLAALSISLLLHLREVRYHALVVLLGGAIFRVHLGRLVFERVAWRRWAVELAALLVLLFHTFFQAFFAFAGLLALERGVAWLRGRAPARDLAPFAAAAALVAPALVFFETFSIARSFAESFAFGVVDYVRNLAAIGAHLLRHEFLAPALVCRAAVVATGAGRPEGRRVAAGLSAFAAGYVALGCLNPLALERYFVVLSPLLTGVFLLDAFALVRLAPMRVAAVAGLVALTVLLRLPGAGAVAGRVAEITTPVRGPLDHVIPFLLERYPEPAELVIATNYEEYAFMYYLGSHVIVGLSGNNLARDRALDPDVIVPRARWPRSLAELRPFLARAPYEAVRFPVRDLHHNTIPALSPSRFVPEPHRFESAPTADPGEQLVVYLRASSAKRTGTSSRP